MTIVTIDAIEPNIKTVREWLVGVVISNIIHRDLTNLKALVLCRSLSI
jgi:hypothetical protein